MLQIPKNVFRLLMVAVAAFVALLIGSSQAMAYPACDFGASLQKGDEVVRAGESVVINTTANVKCAWSVEWNGQTRTRTTEPNVPFRATFVAPNVSKRTQIDAHVTCNYVDTGCTGGAAARAANWSSTLPVIVLPRGANAGPTASASGDLPNTGGPSWYLLVGGLLLLVAGAGAVRASKREAVEVEQS